MRFFSFVLRSFCGVLGSLSNGPYTRHVQSHDFHSEYVQEVWRRAHDKRTCLCPSWNFGYKKPAGPDPPNLLNLVHLAGLYSCRPVRLYKPTLILTETTISMTNTYISVVLYFGFYLQRFLALFSASAPPQTGYFTLGNSLHPRRCNMCGWGAEEFQELRSAIAELKLERETLQNENSSISHNWVTCRKCLAIADNNNDIIPQPSSHAVPSAAAGCWRGWSCSQRNPAYFLRGGQNPNYTPSQSQSRRYD